MVTAAQAGAKLHDATGGILCLDFVNTVDRVTDRPWVDRLQGYADLLAWSEAAGTLRREAARLRAAAKGRPRAAEAVLARARELREAHYGIFSALAGGRAPARADLALANAELARALSRSRVVTSGAGFAWSWDAAATELDLPLWPIARSAAELLISPERALVKRCAGTNCLWLFLDRSKNHGRRWCDMKVCGNRAKVRRHRRRSAAG
jgi:predicted RNA-binding Zn ribbon-like protein